MAIPPAGHPARPLHLAAQAARVLGWVCLVFGAIGFCATASITGPRGLVLIVLVMTVVLFYFLPGWLYLLLAGKILLRRKWAVITAMTVGGVHGLFVGLALLGGVRQEDMFTIVASLLFASLQLLMIVFCGMSFKALAPDGGPRGFTPIMANDLSVTDQAAVKRSEYDWIREEYDSLPPTS